MFKGISCIKLNKIPWWYDISWFSVSKVVIIISYSYNNRVNKIIKRPSKEIDYIYFIIENKPGLTDNNFNIEFDNKESASSKITIDKS